MSGPNVLESHNIEPRMPYDELPVGLPMPQRPELLRSGAQRVRVRSSSDRFPFPIPNGWFAIARTGEIQPGQIVALRYFGQDLVAFAGEDGTVHTYKRVTSPGLERETFGLGLGVVRRPGMVTFLSSVTPVDEDNVHVRWIFTAPLAVGADTLEQIAMQFTLGITQDLPIWENKVYRERPVLTRGEAGIIAHRNWSEQFYSRPAQTLKD